MTRKNLLPAIALLLLAIMAAIAIWPFANERRIMLRDAVNFMKRGMNREAWNELAAARSAKPDDPKVLKLIDIMLLNGLDGTWYRGVKRRGLPIHRFRSRILMLDSSMADSKKTEIKNPFSVHWTGYLDIPLSGTWSIGVSVDDGARLLIDQQAVCDCLSHNGLTRCMDTIHLEKGFHDITLEYANFDGPYSLKVLWTPPDKSRAVSIPPENFYPSSWIQGSDPNLQRGLSAMELGSFDEALKILLKISRTDPGYPKADRAISDLLLGGLEGSYWENTSFKGTPVLIQRDLLIDYTWDYNFNYPVETPSFSARWKGYLRISKAGYYSFATSSDDGSRLFINNKTVVNNWGPHDTRYRQGRPLRLTRGMHPIRLEFADYGGKADLQLYWITPLGKTRELIPASALSPYKRMSPVAAQVHKAKALYEMKLYDKALEYFRTAEKFHPVPSLVVEIKQWEDTLSRLIREGT